MEVAEQRHVGTYAHLCAQLIAESKDSGLVVLRQGEHTWEAVREHVLAQEAREHADTRIRDPDHVRVLRSRSARIAECF